MKEDGYLRIGPRRIGKGEPCYVIAEGGVNHNGYLTIARRLADAAREAGADAIKFQKRKLSEVYQEQVLAEPRRGEQGLQYMVPLLAEFELADDEFRELAAYCRRIGIEFLCTPWDKCSVDFLEALAVPAYKIGSPDMTNFPLIEYVARTNKPFLISTGMATEDEIRASLAFVKTLGAECGVFHCVSTYPVSADEVNLRFMQRLREWCDWPVGYSGHEDGIAISTAAVAMGAVMLERHITLDRTMRGPDHPASLEPPRFKELVDAVREVETALGVSHRWISRGEVLNRRVLAKSLVAAVDIPAGTPISADMLGAKSPGMGLSPQHIQQVVGRGLRRALRRDEMLLESDLREPADDDATNVISLGMPWGVVARVPDLEPLFARFGPQGMAFVEMHLSDRDLDAGMAARPAGSYPLGLVVHAPEYCHDELIDLCAANPDQHAMSIRRIQQTIDLTRQLAGSFERLGDRGPKIVVHVGGMSRKASGYDREAAAARLAEAVRALDMSEVDLLLENLPPRPWFFGGRWAGHMLVDAENTRAMCEMTGLGLCFDTSHAGLACHLTGDSMEAFARAVRPFVRHLHLADAAGTSGEGLQIGDGQVDFLGLWPLLVQADATCVPEIWMGHHNGGSGFQTALNRLADIAWAADALSGVRRDDRRSELARLVLRAESSIATAMRAIDANTRGVILLVDARGTMLGLATDGDVRRALLAGHTLQDRVDAVMNRDFVFAFADAAPAEIDARLSSRCRIVPVLDASRRLVDVVMRAPAASVQPEGAAGPEVGAEPALKTRHAGA